MSERDRIVCSSHGETPATFACRHLASGVACGFHSAPTADDPWPDAWCDLCDETLAASGGEWDEASENVADIKLLCAHCYEAARERNRTVPALARGAERRMTNTEVTALIRHASDAAHAQQDESTRRWGWGDLPRWDFDSEASTLTFSDLAGATVVADVRLVGSFSTRTSTFQWAWETFGDEAHNLPIAQLRVFGEVREIAALTTPKRECEEVDGWEMTSLAAYLLGAEAVYRAPMDHLYWFMLLSRFRTAS